MTDKKVKIYLDGKEIICDEGATIMRVAQDNGMMLPNLCYHPDFSVKANCRICVVEVAYSADSVQPSSLRPDFGMKAPKSAQARLVTACDTKVKAGMEIITDTARVKRSRNLNIELIFAEHIEKCPTCIWRVNCKLLELAERDKIEICRFKDRKGKRQTYKFANAVEIDSSQCIDCRNCLEACNDLQKINYLELRGKGVAQEIVPVTEKGVFAFAKADRRKVDCIYCGQCALHCPVGAAQEQADWHLVEKALKNKSEVLVAQIAHSIRVSIGEEFGVETGRVMTGQVVAALKKLGFAYVFDVNFGADVTTIVEAEELIERLKIRERLLNHEDKKLEIRNLKFGKVTPISNLPMFTSCCPAWIKYVEFFRPDLIPNMTTARSPQMHSAGIIKTYWAEKMSAQGGSASGRKIKPKNIVVVSIMPCTAKKFESSRKELKIRGDWPIDYCLTTRELAWLIKKNKIDFKSLKAERADNPLGTASGAGAIYGATGGVMESALRTAAYLMATAQDRVCRDLGLEAKIRFGDSEIQRVEFKDVRGQEGVKTANLEMGGKKVRVAVVNGIGSIQPILDKLKDFDYIEVMACPDGCIGGGGQPIPTTAEIRKKRLAALYKIDGASKIRRAHENDEAIGALSWLKKQGKLEKTVLYTTYKKRS